MTKSASPDQPDQRVELLEEQLQLRKHLVELGRVLIETKVETTPHVVEALLKEEEIKVERVPVGEFVEEVPPIREENGVLIIPVLEERLVVQTRLMLKEELRVSKTVSEELVRRTIPLRAEHATVTRLEEPDLRFPIIMEDEDQ
ncbi:YsnF/AvaK domain-containing protein [Geminicoccus harenae]|uniref:YsnF/AvaK domain-containing protein n=3 Tax=Geminicoccus harenae TaxID=2498453 RepID=UPI001C952857|nr:DUF2382 domain-containing protein [Geminicoccus harenae]